VLSKMLVEAMSGAIMLPTDQKVGRSNPSGRAADLQKWPCCLAGVTQVPLVTRISCHKPCHAWMVESLRARSVCSDYPVFVRPT
jgi:hypothetical protein